MNIQFYNQKIWGNSLKNYLLFAAFLIIGLSLKRYFSKFLSWLLFLVFKKFYSQSTPQKFNELLYKHIEFLVVILLIYTAINQLDYTLNEIIFKRINNIENAQKVFSITIIEVVDKLFTFLVILSSVHITLRMIDFMEYIFAKKASHTVSRTHDQMVPFIKELSKIAIIVACVFIVMGSIFNLNVTIIIAGLGIGGIAIALAAQDTLQNLLGSFTIFADKPFVVGDLVHIEG